MAYCRTCGTEIGPNMTTCPSCGASQNISGGSSDSGSFGWTVLGCCIPIVGLVLWLVWKNDKPETAKAAGMGVVIYLVFAALSFLAGACGALS